MKRRTEEKAYKAYVTDALMAITNNTAKFAGGFEIKMRYIDIVSDKQPEEQTEEEIRDNLVQKLKGIK